MRASQRRLRALLPQQPQRLLEVAAGGVAAAAAGGVAAEVAVVLLEPEVDGAADPPRRTPPAEPPLPLLLQQPASTTSLGVQRLVASPGTCLEVGSAMVAAMETVVTRVAAGSLEGAFREVLVQALEAAAGVALAVEALKLALAVRVVARRIYYMYTCSARYIPDSS